MEPDEFETPVQTIGLFSILGRKNMKATTFGGEKSGVSVPEVSQTSGTGSHLYMFWFWLVELSLDMLASLKSGTVPEN